MFDASKDRRPPPVWDGGVQPSADYRNVPEVVVLDSLLLGGFAYELRSGGSAASAAQKHVRVALNGWVDAGLPWAQAADGGRLFDPVEVLNFLKWAGLGGRDDFWIERYVSTGRRLVSDLKAPADPAVGPDAPAVFKVQFQRTFSATPRGRVRLRAPLPLNTALQNVLQITPALKMEEYGQVRVSPGRLELQMEAASGCSVTIGALATFSTAPAPIAQCGDPLSEAERQLYSRPMDGLIAVTPKVSALAAHLTASGSKPLIAAQKFWDYMMDHLVCGAVHYDQIGAKAATDWVLDHGWFDCQLGAALLASLCRAIGIPARLVGGYLLYALAPTNHYWAEVWIDGRWIPYDWLCWDLSGGGADKAWRARFAAKLDYRMVTELYPRHFVGALGVEIPKMWQIVQAATPEGVSISFLNAIDEAIYIDTIQLVCE